MNTLQRTGDKSQLLQSFFSLQKTIETVRRIFDAQTPNHKTIAKFI